MSRPQQILDLDPSDELVFKGPFSSVVTTSLTLKNPTNEKIGFKVKTTAPKQYCVRPNSGIIPPHGEQIVSVMLQPTDEVHVSDRSKHKFMVQSLGLEEDVSVDDLDATMRAAGKTKLMDSKLKCVFADGDQTVYHSSDDASIGITNSSDGDSNILSTEEAVPSLQPTAGSTPSHSNTSQPSIESEKAESEVRMLRERTKTLAEENKFLKTETDRLKQQFLTRTTSVKSPIRPASQQNQSSLNLVAVLLILVALVLGYFVGTYVS